MNTAPLTNAFATPATLRQAVATMLLVHACGFVAGQVLSAVCVTGAGRRFK